MASKTYEIEFQDGKTIEVTPTLEDTLAFETTLRKNKRWGELKENAIKLIPFRAWNAAVRNGLTKLTWEEFTTGKTAAVDVSLKDEPETDDDDASEVEGVGKAGPKAARTTP